MFEQGVAQRATLIGGGHFNSSVVHPRARSASFARTFLSLRHASPRSWFEAARASLAAAVSELAAALPKLSSCHRAALLMKSEGLFIQQVLDARL